MYNRLLLSLIVTSSIALCVFLTFKNSYSLTSRRLNAVDKFRARVKHIVDSHHIRMSDKFDAHSYYTIYGKYLHTYILDAHHSGNKVKFLEIGLGCNHRMNEGPGASIELWRAMYPTDTDIWVGEYDRKCVDDYSSKLKEMNVSAVVGDQSNATDVHRWVKETGGRFDIIIDDGGHSNAQILNTFHILFNDALAPGGIYFIEDLQVGRTLGRWYVEGEAVVSDVIQDWIDQLLIPEGKHKYPIPQSINWIGCQREACVIEKSA